MKHTLHNVLCAALTICVVLLLGGCGGTYVVNSMYKNQNLPDPKNAASAESMYVTDKPMIDTGSEAFRKAFVSAHCTVTERNALIIRIRLVADEVCKQHLGDIRGNATALNITFGSLTTLFSTLASLDTGMAARTLSASATVTNASRSLVNEELYRQAFADSIIRAITLDRKEKAGVIEAGMRVSGANGTPGDYTIEQAILDLQDYHDRCSFMNGVGLISKAVESRTLTKDEIVAKMDSLRVQISKNDSESNKATAPETKRTYDKANQSLQSELDRLGTMLTSSR